MSELRFEWKNMLAADLGEESCVPDLLGERILQNSLKFYLDETAEIYEGYGKVADSYPYRQRNNYKRQLKEKQIRTAVLENNQLKAVFLPDYGGRLWELWDKNENFKDRNNANVITSVSENKRIHYLSSRRSFFIVISDERVRL